MKKKTLYIICAISTILSLIAFALSAVITSVYPHKWWTILVSSILMIVLFVLTCVIYFKNTEFICTKCNQQFKPTVNASLWAIHTITRRHLHCPHCNETSWCKETWNIEK